MLLRKPIFSLTSAAFILAILVAMPATSIADGNDKKKSNVVIYFTRHAEKQTQLKELENGQYEEICGTDKCSEELSSLGELRAELLADWFKDKGITDKLTHIFSSHKLRTLQTIRHIAAEAELEGDNDKNANDGVQEFPILNADTNEFATELSPEGTSSSEDPTIDALKNLAPGSVALVAGHSGTLYDIMQGLGLTDVCTKATVETCNKDRYPINKKFKVANFGDIWKIELTNRDVKFRFRTNLQPVKLKSKELVR